MEGPWAGAGGLYADVSASQMRVTAQMSACSTVNSVCSQVVAVGIVALCREVANVAASVTVVRNTTFTALCARSSACSRRMVQEPRSRSGDAASLRGSATE